MILLDWMHRYNGTAGTIYARADLIPLAAFLATENYSACATMEIMTYVAAEGEMAGLDEIDWFDSRDQYERAEIAYADGQDPIPYDDPAWDADADYWEPLDDYSAIDRPVGAADGQTADEDRIDREMAPCSRNKLSASVLTATRVALELWDEYRRVS